MERRKLYKKKYKIKFPKLMGLVFTFKYSTKGTEILISKWKLSYQMS